MTRTSQRRELAIPWIQRTALRYDYRSFPYTDRFFAIETLFRKRERYNPLPFSYRIPVRNSTLVSLASNRRKVSTIRVSNFPTCIVINRAFHNQRLITLNCSVQSSL